MINGCNRNLKGSTWKAIFGFFGGCFGYRRLGEKMNTHRFMNDHFKLFVFFQVRKVGL